MENKTQTTAQQTLEQGKRIPCEVYSRIVGYLRPIQNWHDGKRQEYLDRKEYVLDRQEERTAAHHG